MKNTKCLLRLLLLTFSAVIAQIHVPSTVSTVNISNKYNTYIILPQNDITNRTQANLPPTRIVGGKAISIRQAPWQVALIRNRKIICGGSVLNRIWVLTAAHCVDTGSGRYTVRGGTRFFKNGGQTRAVSLIVIHGRYNQYTLDFDIAMLRLRSGFNFGPTLRPVRLAGPRMRIPRIYFVTGWGVLNEYAWNPTRSLRAVTVASVSRKRCQKSYRADGGITRNQICAAAPDRDSCSIDSGGALVRNRIQYGIVSFGIGCARRRYPGVYTDVRRMRRWINFVRRKF